MSKRRKKIKYWTSDHECCQLCKEVAGLVGAVDGDITGHIKELISLMNRQSWKLEKAIGFVKWLKDELKGGEINIDVLKTMLDDVYWDLVHGGKKDESRKA